MSGLQPWPRWSDRLPPPADGSRRAEGGRRLDAATARVAPTPAPLLSYVTVVRNAQATLARTLRSVREQQGPSIEHIVIDGLSDDGTLAVIEAHAAQIDYYVSEADRGLYDALNKAIPLARGELICVLNADDWLAADAAMQVAQARLQAGPAQRRLFASAAWAMHGSRWKFWPPGRLDLGGYLRCANVCHNGVYATRGAYEASGPYDAQLRIAADFRWLMACVDAGVEVRALQQPTVHYSMGGLSGNTRLHTDECVQILRQRFDFLTEAEAWGLVHAFHVFRQNLAPFAATRPVHLGRFIAEAGLAHRDRADFVTALGLASIGFLMHPEDPDAPGRLSFGEKARRSLRRLGLRLRAMRVG